MVSLTATLSRRWKQSSSTTLLAVGLLSNLLSMVSVVSSEATEQAPKYDAALSPEQNPYGFKVSYGVVWLNEEQHAFGGQFNISMSRPIKGASWVLKFQFADSNTRADNYWGQWDLEHITNTTYNLAKPKPLDNGVDIVEEGDTTVHSYAFNGKYNNDDKNAIYPNYYAYAPNDKVKPVILTPFEVSNKKLPDTPLPTSPPGEYNRQQRTASAGSATNAVGGNDSNSASADSNSSGNVSAGSGSLTGITILGGILAVGLTVVGIATYRRREYRRDVATKKDDTILPKFAPDSMAKDAVKMPPPSAINNHSVAARAAAGAVIMEEMNADQAMAEEYYVMEDVAPDAHHHHLEMAADEYNAIEAMPEHDDGVYYAEYDAEMHQEFYPMEGEGQYEMEEPYVDGHGEAMYEGEYVEGLPDYAIQYDDEVGYDGHMDEANHEVYHVEETANHNNASGGNGAIEHVDLRAPVAQEYYVSNAIAYDDEGHDLGLDQSAHDGHDQGYGHAYEAGDYEATEFDDGQYEQQQHHHHHQY